MEMALKYRALVASAYKRSKVNLTKITDFYHQNTLQLWGPSKPQAHTVISTLNYFLSS